MHSRTMRMPGGLHGGLCPFLSNVHMNSRSRSQYAVARPSSVCL